MAQQTLNATAGGPDDNLPTATAKLNSMFGELYALQSSTLNAADPRFAGATDEISINNAINMPGIGAIAIGADRVLIPSSMLPFDATQVSSNVLVQQVREGGDFSIYDVLAYGADPTKTADATAAIRACCLGAGAAGNAGIVRGSAGRYRVTGSIFVPPFVSIVGDVPDGVNPTTGVSLGVGFSLHATNGIMAGLPILDVSTGCAVLNVGFEVDGNNARFNTVLAIADATAAASEVKIDRCHFHRFGGAVVKIRGGVTTITRCRANNCNSHLFWLWNDGTNTGSDCFVAFNDSGGNQSFLDPAGAVGAAIFIDGSGEHTIIGNQLYEYQFGIWVKTGSGNRIVGNRTEKNGQTGIQVDTGSVRNIVANNRAFNNGLTAGQTGAGIKVDNAHRNRIHGNTLSSESSADYGAIAQQFGVWLNNGALNNEVDENTIEAVFDDGIRVIGGSHNNKIHNNYEYSVQKYGIRIDGSDDCAVTENYIWAAGQAADNTYAGVLVGSNTCNRTVISRNTVRHGGGATRLLWGVQVVAGGDQTVIEFNDLRNSCRAFPSISDGGTNTQRQGNKAYIGTSGKASGTIVLSAANPAATVATTEVATGDMIRLVRQAAGGTLGHLSIGTVTNQTSFTIVASGNADTSTVLWEIVH